MHPAPIGRGSCVLAREHPRAKQQSPEWQAATEALLMAAGDRGPLMHARIGVPSALNRNVERVFNQSRKDTH